MEFKEHLSLHCETRKLLIEHSVDMKLKDIAKATGINPRWLKALKAGEYENPGVNPTQRLYEYLSGKTLTV